MKVNAILKEIKSDNISENTRLIEARVIYVGRKVDLKPNQRRGNAVKKNPVGKEEYNNQNKVYGNILTL